MFLITILLLSLPVGGEGALPPSTNGHLNLFSFSCSLTRKRIIDETSSPTKKMLMEDDKIAKERKLMGFIHGFSLLQRTRIGKRCRMLRSVFILCPNPVFRNNLAVGIGIFNLARNLLYQFKTLRLRN